MSGRPRDRGSRGLQRSKSAPRKKHFEAPQRKRRNFPSKEAPKPQRPRSQGARRLIRQYSDPRVSKLLAPHHARGQRAVSEWLQVGVPARVERGKYKGSAGIVKHVGAVDFAQGLWVGIALKSKAGQHDGSVQGVRYFKCPPGHGIFLKSALIAPDFKALNEAPPPSQDKKAAKGKLTGFDLLGKYRQAKVRRAGSGGKFFTTSPASSKLMKESEKEGKVKFPSGPKPSAVEVPPPPPPKPPKTQSLPRPTLPPGLVHRREEGYVPQKRKKKSRHHIHKVRYRPIAPSVPAVAEDVVDPLAYTPGGPDELPPPQPPRPSPPPVEEKHPPPPPPTAPPPIEEEDDADDFITVEKGKEDDDEVNNEDEILDLEEVGELPPMSSSSSDSDDSDGDKDSDGDGSSGDDSEEEEAPPQKDVSPGEAAPEPVKHAEAEAEQPGSPPVRVGHVEPGEVVVPVGVIADLLDNGLPTPPSRRDSNISTDSYDRASLVRKPEDHSDTSSDDDAPIPIPPSSQLSDPSTSDEDRKAVSDEPDVGQQEYMKKSHHMKRMSEVNMLLQKLSDVKASDLDKLHSSAVKAARRRKKLTAETIPEEPSRKHKHKRAGRKKHKRKNSEVKTHSKRDRVEASPPPRIRRRASMPDLSMMMVDGGEAPPSLARKASIQELNEDNLARLAREKKYRNTMAELLESETLYGKHLQMLLHHYVRPLQNTRIQKSLGLAHGDVDDLFSNIETIANFHKVLALDLANEAHIGRVFVKNMPFLNKMYVQYVQTYEDSMLIFLRLSSNGKFQKFLSRKRSQYEQTNQLLEGDASIEHLQDLMSYLVMPVQRIPRYELLLTRLLENCPDDPENESNLAEAIDLLKETARVERSSRALASLPEAIRSDLEDGSASPRSLSLKVDSAGSMQIPPGLLEPRKRDVPSWEDLAGVLPDPPASTPPNGRITPPSEDNHTDDEKSEGDSDPGKDDSDDDMEFLWAAEDGNAYRIVRLLKTHPVWLSARDEEGETAIHKAARYGHVDIVNVLLEAKADVDLRDNDDHTPLIFATMNGHALVMATLLENKADPNACDAMGSFPLLLAAGWSPEPESTLKTLLRAPGLDFDQADSQGVTVTQWASQYERFDITKMLATGRTNSEIDAKRLQLLKALHSPKSPLFIDAMPFELVDKTVIRSALEEVFLFADLQYLSLDEEKRLSDVDSSDLSLSESSSSSFDSDSDSESSEDLSESESTGEEDEVNNKYNKRIRHKGGSLLQLYAEHSVSLSGDADASPDVADEQGSDGEGTSSSDDGDQDAEQ